MSDQTNLVVYAVIGIIIGAAVGYFAAGPITYSPKIKELEQTISDLQQQEPPELSGNLQLGGSTTVAPIAQECLRLFMEDHPKVSGSYSPTGSGSGIKAAGSGEIDIGGASRDIRSSEYLKYPNLAAFAVAKDSVAVVINPDNELAGEMDITLEEVSQIFAGEITNWSELGGADHEIEVYTREEGSGTRATFVKYAMFEKEFTGDASVQDSNGAMRASVAGNEHGIAYISLGYIDDTVSAIKIGGIEATVENVMSGDFPITRILWLFTKGMPSELETAFLDFVLSETGQQVVEDQGFIPLFL